MKIGKVAVVYVFILKLYQISLNPNEEQKSYFIDAFNNQQRVGPFRAGEFGLN